MVNTHVWCIEELSCENPAAAFTLFVLENMSSQDYSSHVLPFIKLYFSKYVLAANWGLTGSLLLFPVFPATLFILDCAGSESQIDRQARSRWDQTMEKHEKVREWHAADYIHGFYRWRWRWHDLMPVIIWCQQETCSKYCVLSILRKQRHWLRLRGRQYCDIWIKNWVSRRPGLLDSALLLVV